MLELEVVPERSIGCEQWEFILGKSLILNSVTVILLVRLMYRLYFAMEAKLACIMNVCLK